MRLFQTASAVAAGVLTAALLQAGLPAADAAPDDPAFETLTGFRATGPKVRVRPREYQAVRVDTGEVRSDLRSAPRAGSAGATTFRVPTPRGGTERFAVQRTAIMQASLAAAHPEIRTWSGRSLDNPGTTVALDVTPLGFHAAVRPPGGKGTWYVDPAYDRRGTTEHLSYFGRALPRPERRFVEREAPDLAPAIARRAERIAGGATVRQRVYRLALLSDPTYAGYFGPANVTAAKVTLINRVNQVYNDDLAIKLVLVDNTDRLSLATAAEATGPNGPCGAHPCFTDDLEAPGYVEGQIAYCDVGTLVRTQTVLGQLVGAGNYDVGHLALGTNGGGIAGLGVVGGIEKGQGCTGIPTPIGDYYAIDYVAHELGHQFGGNHTFNGVRWNCSGGNRNAETSVEPGSGSSIMAYAGICRQDNIQPHSDPYFSQRSQTEIGAYTATPARAPVEVQDVSLTGFDTDGESITLDYPGPTPSVTLVRGGTGPTAYNRGNLEAAIESLTGEDVTVAGWGYDPYSEIYEEGGEIPADLTEPDDSGFQVMFAGDADPYTEDSDRTDMASLLVGTTSPGVTARVGETARGGEVRNTGFDVNTTGNRAPRVRAPGDRRIPVRTPFTLTGQGRDADGDPLSYLWEQNDVGGETGTALVDNAKVDGPLFRVFGTYADVSAEDALESPSPGQNLAGRSPTRTFPDLAQVLAGNTNAETGQCPAAPPDDPDVYVVVPVPVVECYAEFLPVPGYVGSAGTPASRAAMRFRLTARDGAPEGGGYGYDDVTLRLDPDAGPFLVSSFRTGGSVRGGERTTVRWQVNGTRRLAPRVRVLLSTDGGTTWRTVVARTRNDGSTRVRMPRRATASARLMVSAVGNYFFDVNDAPFRIR
ncbi:M12 family metallo-peptidase [Nocardioides pantholopis]|uniref:M12 family metallo-peptidase n=1 Tax=Nocardioides pantholopis TaxID=2483798 RepID=UPI000F082C5A|nr:M12 family metallo-peptidase [Nocardioides pantholopis]